jgi:hypothetical protein
MIDFPDFHAIETDRDARAYSDMFCDEAPSQDQVDIFQVLKVCAEIRKAQLTEAGVIQILNTLSCRMNELKMDEVDIAVIDDAADSI